MPQTLLELGGEQSKPILSFAPANGFVPQVYLPMLRPLMADYRVVSVPPRALWGDEAAPEPSPSQTWEAIADDLLAAYTQFGLNEIVAIGHSFGGIASLLAALKAPEQFRAIVVLDPTILSRQICEWMRQAIAEGKSAHSPLAEGARRRRNQFESIEDIYQRFKGKSVFADWDDEVLRLYAEYGTLPNPDGSRRLAWPPEWEAFYFSTYYADIWRELPKLRDLAIPMLFIEGGSSDTYVPAVAQEVAEILPNATHISIPGHGHLFPQSAPQPSAKAIQEWLEKIGLTK
jgi:pimeloyl-ACP methyl ester carboxylesterase